MLPRSSVERFVAYFPSRSTDGELEVCAIPGPDVENCAVAAGYDATFLANEGLLADTVVATKRIALPKKLATHGPVRAICIAPDSLIKECDIAIHGERGEVHRHRCSPGNPVLVSADAEADFALITIPMSIPPVTRGASGQTGPNIAADASVVSEIDSQDTFGFPLRLEVWRGDILPMRVNRRADQVVEFIGEMIFEDGDWQNTDYRTCYVCTDGRSEIMIQAMAIQGEVSIECFALEARKTPGGSADVDSVSRVQLELDETGATSLTMNAAASGNPISRRIHFPGLTQQPGVGMAPTVLEIKITGLDEPEAPEVGTNRFSVKLRARDN